jgi:hypothetical protein
MSIRLRYVHQDVDRYGNVRIYFWRKGGPKVRIREQPGSEEFARRYQELLHGVGQEPGAEPRSSSKPVPGTYHWLCVE